MRTNMEIDKRLIETLSLFKRHVYLLKRHSENQENIVKRLETLIDKKSSNKINEVLDLFNYVFLFVDLSVRLQKIAYSIPRISHKSDEYRAFEKELKNLKEVRNKFQHINNEVASDGTDHLLGTISWFSNSKIYAASFQDISRERSGKSIPFEVTADQKLIVHQNLCYVMESNHYDLENIFKACIELQKYIDSKFKLKDENGFLDLKTKHDAWAVNLTEVDGGVEVEWA